MMRWKNLANKITTRNNTGNQEIKGFSSYAYLHVIANKTYTLPKILKIIRCKVVLLESNKTKYKIKALQIINKSIKIKKE